jgi:hypothetical protein
MNYVAENISIRIVREKNHNELYVTCPTELPFKKKPPVWPALIQHQNADWKKRIPDHQSTRSAAEIARRWLYRSKYFAGYQGILQLLFSEIRRIKQKYIKEAAGAAGIARIQTGVHVWRKGAPDV